MNNKKDDLAQKVKELNEQHEKNKKEVERLNKQVNASKSSKQ